jgi:ketosteroid isomerase-like protein
MMISRTMSRRTLLEASVWAMATGAGFAQTANARAETGPAPSSEATIRKYYAAWEQREWSPFDILLADNFTFTSAAGDDHLVKSVFKTKCWASQKDFIERFDLERVYGRGNEALVMYLGHTKNGKTFRNVEYLRLRDDKVETIECYFGAQSSFPSAVGKG